MRYTSCEAIEMLSKDRITGKHKRKERGATVPRPSLSSCDFVEELTKKVIFSRYSPSLNLVHPLRLSLRKMFIIISSISMDRVFLTGPSSRRK